MITARQRRIKAELTVDLPRACLREITGSMQFLQVGRSIEDLIREKSPAAMGELMEGGQTGPNTEIGSRGGCDMCRDRSAFADGNAGHGNRLAAVADGHRAQRSLAHARTSLG